MKSPGPKPIEFHQLCAVVRNVIQRERAIDDTEWKARTLDAVVRLGFLAPKPEQLGRAMDSVEQAMNVTVGPRPGREPVKAAPAPRLELSKEARTNRPLGWDRVVALMATLQPSATAAPILAAPTRPSETLPLDEVAALNEFWRAAWADGANRLELVRAFAEIAILRPAEWDYAAVRAQADEKRRTLSARTGCLVCRADSSDWHHVIQIQFGGSNYVRNFVPLCVACHGAVHPWLSGGTRTRGWTALGDLIATLTKHTKGA